MKVYNGEGMILGRLAAKAAKEALLGEEVKIVNCEKIVISGDKDNTHAREKRRRDRKGYRGIPENLAGELISIKEAAAAKLPTLKYTTVGEVCNRLSGK